jgi:hypothetical protein
VLLFKGDHDPSVYYAEPSGAVANAVTIEDGTGGFAPITAVDPEMLYPLTGCDAE